MEMREVRRKSGSCKVCEIGIVLALGSGFGVGFVSSLPIFKNGDSVLWLRWVRVLDAITCHWARKEKFRLIQSEILS
jgi:hypothetical protein